MSTAFPAAVEDSSEADSSREAAGLPCTMTGGGSAAGAKKPAHRVLFIWTLPAGLCVQHFKAQPAPPDAALTGTTANPASIPTVDEGYTVTKADVGQGFYPSDS